MFNYLNPTNMKKGNELNIYNPLPQGDWIDLADFLKKKYFWNREHQKLIIHLDEKYKLPQFVTLLNEITEMVDKCNEIFGVEIHYEEILVHKTIKTITQGIIEPMVTSIVETISDKRHVAIFEGREPYMIKVY